MFEEEVKDDDDFLYSTEMVERPPAISNADLTPIRDALLSLKVGQGHNKPIIDLMKGCFGDDPRGLELLRDWIATGTLQYDSSERDREKLLSGFDSRSGFQELIGPDLEAEWKRAQPKKLLSAAQLVTRLKHEKYMYGLYVDWPNVDEKTKLPKLRCQLNIREALKHIGVAIFKNEFDGRIYIEGFEGAAEEQELSDDIVNALWLKVDALGLPTPRDFFDVVVREIARCDQRHPLKDYLEECERKWDGVSRIDTALIDYAGAEPTVLNKEFTRLWLTAAVARVFQPGVKFDQMLVLQSDEGTQKSSLLRVLAGDRYFDDCATLGQSPKDMIEQTRGVWILEIPELDKAKRDTETIKATLSRREDRATLKYDRLATSVPRAFIMTGTTNKDIVSNSDTGARRFWPVKVGKIDLDGVKAVRDQLWGEAVHLWKTKGEEGLKLQEKFWASAKELQRQRSSRNPIKEVLEEALENRSGRITVEALWAVSGYEEKSTRKPFMRDQIHEAVVQLGWQDTQFRDGPDRHRGYKKAPASLDEDGFQPDLVGDWRYDTESGGLTDAGGGASVAPAKVLKPNFDRRRG